jgi:hypothetical protein
MVLRHSIRLRCARPDDVEGPAGERAGHAQDRRDQARAGDARRDVGDPNRVAREGRAFRDTETGNIAYVKGDRVVIVNSEGQQITQFKATRESVQSRIRSGRWEPK